MAFIGTPLDTRNTFQSLVGKRFSGDGSETEFTLDVAPGSVLDIEVFVGNVRQDPNSAYTLSGTTLSFTGAPPSGTNNIYVVHQAKSVGTIGIPDDTISARTLVTADSSADHVLIEDATDGELKKALYPSGFSVSSITGATELAAQPAATDEIVLSDAGTLKRLDIKHIQNTPSFYAELSSNQSVNSGSWTKITFDSEKHDSDGTFASNRFTPAVAGTYFVTAQVAFDELADGKVAYTAIYFNGSHASGNSGTDTVGGSTTSTASVNMLLTFDTDDYVEVYAYHNHGSARNAIGNSTTESGFGAFRITGF